MLSGLVSAIRTLTIFSVPGKDAENFSSSLYWFPVVGAFLGTLLAACAWLPLSIGWSELASAVVVVGGFIVSRGMHADGMADMADGFWGGGDRERTLSIMKDPTVGSFGALALLSLMLLKWVAILRLTEHGAFALIASGVLLGRLSQVLLAASLPYARKEGGTASGFVGGAGRTHAAVALALSLMMTLPFFYRDPFLLFLLFGAALTATALIGFLSMKKIGGITGDVLGAVSEVTELFVWLAAGVAFTAF